MLRDATLAGLFEVLDLENIRYEYHKTENTMRLPHCGSTILFRSLDDFERLRGTNLAWFGVDELTYCKREAWIRLEGRLRDQHALRLCGFACWTPKGYDWVHERFIARQRPDHAMYMGSPRENKHLPGNFYSSLQGSYDEKFYRQEVLGEYLNIFSGQVYYSFSRASNVVPEQFNGDAQLWLTCDFNVEPMCWALCQIVDRTTRADMMAGKRVADMQVLDEICGTFTITEACAEVERKLNALRGPHQLAVNLTGDAAGSARTHAGASDWQLIMDYFRNNPNIQLIKRVPSSDPPIRDRVNAMNALFCNSAGERRCFIDPRCKEAIRDFEQVTWRADTSGNMTALLDKSDRKRTHISDAISYLAHVEFPLRSRGGFMGGPSII